MQKTTYKIAESGSECRQVQNNHLGQILRSVEVCMNAGAGSVKAADASQRLCAQCLGADELLRQRGRVLEYRASSYAMHVHQKRLPLRVTPAMSAAPANFWHRTRFDIEVVLARTREHRTDGGTYHYGESQLWSWWRKKGKASPRQAAVFMNERPSR